MISVNTFFEKISYKEIVASLVDVMAANFEEFAADQARFNETITLLENELGGGGSPSVSDETDAICQQVGSKQTWIILSILYAAHFWTWIPIYTCGRMSQCSCQITKMRCVCRKNFTHSYLLHKKTSMKISLHT